MAIGRLRNNAPITLTFSLAALLVLIIDMYVNKNFIESFFICSGRGQFNGRDYLGYYRLVSHVLGHANWNHLISNIIYILLLGPILEEKYGGFPMFMMILITAFINGVINVFFIETGLYGASGIVFMMIILASIVNIQRHEIPITFLLVLILYLTQEFMAMWRGDDNISHLSHIIGGVCGSFFGYLIGPMRRKSNGKGSDDRGKDNRGNNNPGV